ncbi:unnamed protein product [Heligmosomoides polygyrus]|uniref:Uncharacterized protein n=1 Tax=Heligmosomoides polygyrus TaxID=6339 RepID=A0A3P8BGL6_HELPZ|nr:unnamed protein product [Heligmosomoides polygyrus]
MEPLGSRSFPSENAFEKKLVHTSLNRVETHTTFNTIDRPSSASFFFAVFDVLDDDDVLAYEEVAMNEPFEIGGEDFELSGLEPYIYLRYNCNEVTYSFVTSYLFMSRVFHLRKDLDSGETVLS